MGLVYNYSLEEELEALEKIDVKDETILYQIENIKRKIDSRDNLMIYMAENSHYYD